MDRNVIVFGATGKTGKLICEELELRNIKHTVFVREPSKDKVSNLSSSIKYGDVMNSYDIENALQNEVFTDVIIALGTKDLKDTRIRSIGTKNIIEAFNKSQSKISIHAISALGVGNSWNQLNWLNKLVCNLLIKSTIKDHNEQENYIIENASSYHIIRPVGLKDGDSKGDILIQNEGFLPRNSIQRVDLARFLVSSMLENKTGMNGICQKK